MQLSLLHYTDYFSVVEERIQRFARYAPRLLVCWSCGKDSTAVLLSALRVVPEKTYAVFIHVVGQTHALNVQCALRVARLLGMAVVRVDARGRQLRLERLPRPPALLYVVSRGRCGEGFWAEARARGWPAPMERTTRHGKRWCCQIFKGDVLEALSKLFRHHVVGIKKSDSPYRHMLLADLDPSLPVKRYDTHATLYPIFDLSDEDVWSLIRGVNREVYEIVKRQYDVFGYSPNCTVCPLQSHSNFEKTVHQMPIEWLQYVRNMLLMLLKRHSCEQSSKWTCKDLTWKLEIVEKELERRTTTPSNRNQPNSFPPTLMG